MFELAFLASDRPLTKHFTLDPTGLVATPYPHVSEFTSHSHNVSTITEFHARITEHAEQQHCLLKGTLTKALNRERRAGSTDRTTATHWLVFDVDGLEGIQQPKDFIKLLPKAFHGVSYVLQYSPSMGIVPTDALRAHLFFMLSAPILPAVLKLWFKHLNLSTPFFRERLKLSRVANAIKWPVDPTVAQNDKLIYIAPPSLGPNVEDRLEIPRISLAKHRTQHVVLNFDNIQSEDTLRDDELHALNELRVAAGREPRTRYTFKIKNGVEVLLKPDTSMITGVRNDRGFTYLNLDGGDSWGYFFPEDDPEILYNFKGEPNYLLKELAPQFHADALINAQTRKEARQRELNDEFTGAVQDPETGVYHLAFLHAESDKYYRGFYDPTKDVVSITPTGALTKVVHYLKQQNMPVGDSIPEWKLHYDFASDQVFDLDARTINLYQRTDYLRNAKPSKRVPPTINRVIQHMLNYDEIVVEHFLNWLACIMQNRKKTRTAWILHGVQGTGKGVLFNRILRPIIGEQFCNRTKLSAFEREFNGFAERSLLLWIDESEMANLDKGSIATAAIKELITEPTVAIRRMHTDAYTAPNWINMIFASNKYDPAEVDATDRRMNVAPRQEQPLKSVMPDTEVERVDDELYHFTGYLLERNADVDRAATPINTDERLRLQRLTQDAQQRIAHAIRIGDLQFFWEERPESDNLVNFSATTGLMHPPTYDEVMDHCFSNANKPSCMTRTQLEALFYYVGGVSFLTRNKFTTFAGHKGLNLEPIRFNGITTRGLSNVVWKVSPELQSEWTMHKKRMAKSRQRHLKSV